jgi:hypothetical protein
MPAVPRFEHLRPGLPSTERRNPFTGQMQMFPGRPEQRTIFEIEQRGSRVETCVLKQGKRPKLASSRYATPAQAEATVRATIARKLAAKYVEVGTVQLLAPAQAIGAGGGSTLLLDELFQGGDGSRFLDEVLACHGHQKLTTLAEPWFADARPEMRRALLEYVDDGCDRGFHRGLVKHLFKAAEKHQDDELMAHFMVAFDRLTRRYAVERTTYDRGTVGKQTVLCSDPLVPAWIQETDPKARQKKQGETPRFTRATRRYLARRAFRYFRAIGRSDRARHGRAMRLALPLYEDRHLDTPVRILDSWALVHVLYAWSPVLRRIPTGINVAKGRSLAELTPAPYFKDAWLGALLELLDMLARARSRTVRVWTIAWLEASYATELGAIDVNVIRPILLSPDEDVARFGSKLFRRAQGLATLAVADWLELLRTENLDVAPVVVEAFEKNVAPKRLSLAQLVELTGARVAAVAELGLRWAKEAVRASVGAGSAMPAEDLTALARIAGASVEHVRTDGARWLLELLDAAPAKRPEHLRDLFDSRFADVRALAKDYLESRKVADVPLWFALLESPFDDVRALVVKHAESWQAQAGIGEIEHLALSVLLAVHRGAGAKQSMLRRIADRAAAKPDEADRLLPVLSIALRSVRPPERVGALAALARAAVGHASLRAAVSRHIPELSISDEVVR